MNKNGLKIKAHNNGSSQIGGTVRNKLINFTNKPGLIRQAASPIPPTCDNRDRWHSLRRMFIFKIITNYKYYYEQNFDIFGVYLCIIYLFM